MDSGAAQDARTLGFTVLLWVFGAPLGAALGFAQGYDAAVALFALVLLHGLRLAGWQDVERSTEWGVLLLFGGGLTLSKALAASGAAAWLATQLGGPLAALPAWGCIALMVLFALLLTEVTSNTASAALLTPALPRSPPRMSSARRSPCWSRSAPRVPSCSPLPLRPTRSSSAPATCRSG